MSEEEIIETFKHWIEYEKQNKDKINKADELIEIQQGLLDLYQKEKEKNKCLIQIGKENTSKYIPQNYINLDNIKYIKCCSCGAIIFDGHCLGNLIMKSNDYNGGK